MKYIAAFDIGTTDVKGILVTSDAKPHHEGNIKLEVRYEGDRVEQDPRTWFAAVVQIASQWFSSGISPADIGFITFSGQMQDCIPVNSLFEPLRPAILYSDGRAGEQAKRIMKRLGEPAIHEATANHMDGTLTFPKIMWLKENEPEIYEQTASFLISSKDYVIGKLTGVKVTDPTSASTAGCMNIRERTWLGEWFKSFGLDVEKMPEIRQSDQVAGYVSEQAAALTGFMPGTPVLSGIGDAGAATLGAGVYDTSEIYAYLGTTGWVAGVSEGYVNVSNGVFNLAYVEPGRQITIAPLMNAGNAHAWAVETLGASTSAESSAERYRHFENMMSREDRRSNEVLFLPYLNGERCPVQNIHATGSFIGLRTTTTRANMAVAVLEGVAMAMKQVLELITPDTEGSVSLIGGGAQSASWCQIIADLFGWEVRVPEEAKYLPSIGAAILGFGLAGWGQDYPTLCETIKSGQKQKVYQPELGMQEHYKLKYERYKQLYPALETLFV